ncbi:putative protein phosphatase 2C 73 [Abeliophyllum distichum]|uniref:PPM-type phosphatase domain-containing protein n=1 Tax=Abeliophyllum distichum TaxID=126358 RepID=A0ABD1Q561_9LAMI
MVQLSTLLMTISKNVSIRSRKKRRTDVGKQTADELVKEAKRKELMRTSSGIVNADKYNTFASVHSKRGKKGINQDRFIVWEEFGCQDDMTFCGIFDGHGPWGHIVAKRVRELMPSSLLRNWQEAVALNLLNSGDNLGSNTNHFLFDIWKQSYFKTCSAVDQELQQCAGIDSFYSGTTALTVVRQGNLIVVANVGDSRAVLATTSDEGRLIPVWDVISNQEAIEIVSSTPDREETAKRLVQRAVCAWKRKGRAAAMDDISAICLFFHEYNHPQPVASVKLNSKLE